MRRKYVLTKNWETGQVVLTSSNAQGEATIMFTFPVDNFDDIHIDSDEVISVRWSVDELNHRAVELEEEMQESRKLKKRPAFYDRSKFKFALKLMKDEHDANLGITWDTLDYYLNEYCKLPKKERKRK